MLARIARTQPKHVAVIGAGSIGPDIAWYLLGARPGLRVTLLDIKEDALATAVQRLHTYADKAVARGKLTPAQAASAIAGLTGSSDYAVLSSCDWVIEAATEDLALKRRIFAAVEARVTQDAVITSNTSSIPAERIFAELQHPERATVTHFFAPAWRNPAVEVIDWPGAEPALIAWLRRFFAETGKLALTTTDAPCFMLDRVFDNWCNDAALLLPHANAASIDACAEEFVHAGPFFVLNLAQGNPIIIETNTLQADEEGEHYRPAPIFASVARWQTGKPGSTPAPDANTGTLVRDRLLGVLWSQTVDILDRGIGSAADLDLGCRVALGFKQGPLELMQQAGDVECARVLKRFALERPGMPQPQRALAAYQPALRHVLIDRLDDVVVITLRRPEALNALHDAMTDEILGVITAHEADASVTGFVITGYGRKAFCAGADIGRFHALLGDATAAAQYARDCSRLLVHLDGMRKPVVAALNGLALGGGFELAMRCHGLIAERKAWMQLPEVSLGIVPGIGALVVPYRRWPQAATTFHAMLTQAARLRATEAHALGVVDALADGMDALMAQALAQVRALAKTGVTPVADSASAPPDFDDAAALAADGQTLSASVVELIRSAVLRAAAAPTLAAALEIGYQAFGAAATTAAAREGIDAFTARRAPDFARTG